MRRITTMIVLVSVVVATVAAGPASAAHLTAGAPVSHSVEMSAQTYSAQNDTADDGNLTATGYEIENGELGPDERLHASVTYEKKGDGAASAPLTMSVDGERHRLGSVAVDGERVDVDVDEDAASMVIWIECEWIDSDGDGWAVGDTLRCEVGIRPTVVAAGDHDVGFNGRESSAVTVSDDGQNGDANLTAREFDIEDRSLAPGESTNATVTFETDGEGPASAQLSMTLDGERYQLGTIETDGERVEVDPNDGAAQQVISGMECIWLDVDEDPWKELVCFIVFAPATLDAGDHDVGFNDLEPRTVSVEERSQATGSMLVGDVRGPPCPDIPPGSPGPTIPIPGCEYPPLPW